jgi:hypothetical protein
LTGPFAVGSPVSFERFFIVGDLQQNGKQAGVQGFVMILGQKFGVRVTETLLCTLPPFRQGLSHVMTLFFTGRSNDGGTNRLLKPLPLDRNCRRLTAHLLQYLYQPPLK